MKYQLQMPWFQSCNISSNFFPPSFSHVILVDYGEIDQMASRDNIYICDLS